MSYKHSYGVQEKQTKLHNTYMRSLSRLYIFLSFNKKKMYIYIYIHYIDSDTTDTAYVC